MNTQINPFTIKNSSKMTGERGDRDFRSHRFNENRVKCNETKFDFIFYNESLSMLFIYILFFVELEHHIKQTFKWNYIIIQATTNNITTT